jgi:hypothetical protein
MPSDAIIAPLPTLTQACMTLSAGGCAPSGQLAGSGLSLKRIIIWISAPSVLR